MISLILLRGHFNNSSFMVSCCTTSKMTTLANKIQQTFATAVKYPPIEWRNCIWSILQSITANLWTCFPIGHPTPETEFQCRVRSVELQRLRPSSLQSYLLVAYDYVTLYFARSSTIVLYSCVGVFPDHRKIGSNFVQNHAFSNLLGSYMFSEFSSVWLCVCRQRHACKIV